MSSAGGPDEPKSVDDSEGWVEYVSPSRPGAPLSALGIGASPSDPRLGRRHSALIGLVIPPIFFLTIGTLLSVGVKEVDVREFVAMGLVLLGWSSSEIASMRCDADVRRSRPSRAVYFADRVAIGAFALAVVGEFVASVVEGRMGPGNWRRMLFSAFVLGVALVRLRARRVRERARLSTSVAAAFE